MFDPSSNAKLRWDFLIMALSMVFVFLIPLHLAFNCSLSFFVTQPFTFSCSVIFLIDILVNINTGYFDKGQLRVKHRLVWAHYLKHSFFGDFLGGIFFFVKNCFWFGFWFFLISNLSVWYFWWRRMWFRRRTPTGASLQMKNSNWGTICCYSFCWEYLHFQVSSSD